MFHQFDCTYFLFKKFKESMSSLILKYFRGSGGVHNFIILLKTFNIFLYRLKSNTTPVWANCTLLCVVQILLGMDAWKYIHHKYVPKHETFCLSTVFFLVYFHCRISEMVVWFFKRYVSTRFYSSMNYFDSRFASSFTIEKYIDLS